MLDATRVQAEATQIAGDRVTGFTQSDADRLVAIGASRIFSVAHVADSLYVHAVDIAVPVPQP